MLDMCGVRCKGSLQVEAGGAGDVVADPAAVVVSPDGRAALVMACPRQLGSAHSRSKYSGGRTVRERETRCRKKFVDSSCKACGVTGQP